MKRIAVVGILVFSSTAFAQNSAPGFAPPPGAGGPAAFVPAAAQVTEEQMRMRYQLGVMERALEQAVQFGAQMTGRQLQAAMSPSLWLSGPARARGFRLEGYGVFFDVEVPALRRSIMWSLRELNQPDLAVTTAFDALKQHVAKIADRPARDTLEQALRQIELQVGLPVGPDAGAGDQPGAPTSPPATAGDPASSYTAEVKKALMDAMLDHSGPVALGPDEWLTVAARDNDVRLAANDAYDVLTIVLRIKGSDLTAFRADRLTRDEARNRVEVREF